MLIMIPWALAHWEEYHNGTMLYGNGVWGLTEANYALCILHFITAGVWPSWQIARSLRSTEDQPHQHRAWPATRMTGPLVSHLH